MNWYLLLYLVGLVFPLLNYLVDLNGNNFDAHFSDNALKKMRLKENSILKKLVPFKDGSIIKNGVEVGYRYLLYPRVLAYLIQLIIVFVGLVALLINFTIAEFINDYCMAIVGGISISIWVVYTLIINICSQGLHL